MTKIKLFSDKIALHLEQQVNEFMEGKNVISVSYAPVTVGSIIICTCCVTYQGW